MLIVRLGRGFGKPYTHGAVWLCHANHYHQTWLAIILKAHNVWHIPKPERAPLWSCKFETVWLCHRRLYVGKNSVGQNTCKHGLIPVFCGTVTRAMIYHNIFDPVLGKRNMQLYAVRSEGSLYSGESFGHKLAHSVINWHRDIENRL